jgi:hypothetical protein
MRLFRWDRVSSVLAAMRSTFVGGKRTMAAVALAAWLAGGAALTWIEDNCATVPTNEPASHSVFELLGRARIFAADWFWLQANLAWERHDATETRRLIALSVAADPVSRYYWLNGARMLAYDLPAWANQADPDCPAVLRQRRSARAAAEAMALLQRGTAYHGRCAAFEIEMANICLYALGDRAGAAEHYERAAHRRDAPAYAARVAARLREPAER